MGDLAKQISDILADRGFGATTKAQDRRAAQRIEAALRREDPAKRVTGVRQAVSLYDVTAPVVDGRIELHCDGKRVMVLPVVR